MRNIIFIYLFLSGLFILTACADYTPKPRGYFRIEPPVPQYGILPLDDLPYSFNVSSVALVELPPKGDPAGWINISYPSLKAKIYCSYFPIQPSTLDMAMEESRTLVLRQSKSSNMINEQAFENPQEKVYASLYLLDGESASPIQFTVTDSSANFFRGSLLYDTFINADSLAPATQYIQADIIELIQSFRWEK